MQEDSSEDAPLTLSDIIPPPAVVHSLSTGTYAADAQHSFEVDIRQGCEPRSRILAPGLEASCLIPSTLSIAILPPSASEGSIRLLRFEDARIITLVIPVRVLAQTKISYDLQENCSDDQMLDPRATPFCWVYR